MRRCGLILLLAGVAGAMLVSGSREPRADLTIINRGAIHTVDPQRMSYLQDLILARMLFEGLVRQDIFTTGQDPIPAAAETWEIERFDEPLPNGSGATALRERYTFHLSPDSRWSNGEPIRAQDFVFSWRRAILPDTASDYAGLFMMIRGATRFAAWRQERTSAFSHESFPSSAARHAAADALWQRTLERFEQDVGIHAVDDLTLEIVLEEPTPFFLDLCAFATFFPVYPPLVEQFDVLDRDTGLIMHESGWTKPDRIVSNGPFMLTRWRFKRDMRLETNPYHRRRDDLAIRSIEIPSVEEPNACVLAFESGRVDWVSDVSAEYRARMLEQKAEFYRENADRVAELRARGLDQFQLDRLLPDDPRKNIHAVPVFGTYFYNFNCRPRLADGRTNPFADARVRRAFAMAIDKQSLVDNVVRLGNPTAHTLIPPGSIGGYESPTGLRCISDARDGAEREAVLAEARALLAQAGYPDPAAFPEVEVLFSKDGGHDLIAQAVARDWQQNLGVPVRLAQKETRIYAADMKKGDFMTARAGWYGDYGDPTTFLELNRTSDGNNDRGYHSVAYDSLLDAARIELDPVKRMSILSRAERLIMEQELPMVPLFHYVQVYLFDPDVFSGITPHPRLTQSLFLADILGDGRGPDRPRVMRASPSDPEFGERVSSN
ncbi:MAG: peptide ABC transporter substrate-binding protein [Phycisphaeraceae bacterium]|nr:peptide ABC transporter substrate-binding protein [Phycisphaeraceae bacterium]